jgi:hypothetical protein
MSELPTPQPLDEVEAPVAVGAGGGRVIALVASEDARREGWAPEAAHQLAARWASEGHRIVLADAGLDHPSLHAPAEIPNREGVVDAALFGASASRVSHPVDGYLLITAGSPVADAMGIVRDARWQRFTEGMAEAGVTLMLYLLDGEPGTPGFLGSASDIIVLGSGGEAPVAIRDLEPLVRAVTRPAQVAGMTAASGAPGAVASGASEAVGEEKGGKSEGRGRMVMLIALVVVVIAALGWFLSTGMG